MAIDPVCKMQVDETRAAGKSDYKGKMYYFCAPGCKRKFDEHPEQYADTSAPNRSSSTRYGRER